MTAPNPCLYGHDWSAVVCRRCPVTRTAREALAAHFASDALMDELLDAHAAEVLAGAGAAVPSGPSGRDRRLILLAFIREERGEWGPADVKRLYERLGVTGIHGTTLRDDLGVLHREGRLVLDDSDPNRRVYAAPSAGGCS